MDELQNVNDSDMSQCTYDNHNSNNNNRLLEYLGLDNRTNDPLSEPEVTMNLNEGSTQLPLHPLEELEEDMFDYDTDISLQDVNTESKEQVVPCSQLSTSYKYPEELTISDDEVDEGIFEDEPVSNLVLLSDNNTHDSEPP
ncbi:uncharacterized protein LOC117225105 [Megalopta genalis]|uniref:uncharacterized protein LOC117225105 n=1 Tax=Megalopta genalis TaxID=115081 RepID=UPI001442FF97|nr:uncharacterized protein LOC117225105 [Megalopta genalis]XP_033334320.1 uncharacterized protein LOC117225105 [Megalopta genalis]XP_033334321.1 uncharacterized protein LOC117225105 [Megalopta genalis]